MCLATYIFVSYDLIAITDGVIAYPVMQVYVNLALKDNLEVGEAVLGRCSISCVCTSVF